MLSITPQRRGLWAEPRTRALNDAFTEFTAFGDLAGGRADLLRHTGRLEVNAYRQAARSLTTYSGQCGSLWSHRRALRFMGNSLT